MAVTALYAGLLTTLYLALAGRVIRFRRSRRIDLGDGGDCLFRRYLRGHANFAEYVPLGLVLLLLLEQGGWPGWLLHALGLTLVAGRLAHAWSFSTEELRLPSRTAGTALPLSMLAVAALLCLAQGLGLT
jgi:uncharacterized membrane protein YecN with MAPEG domain